jgi:hypothetical protein
MMPPRRAECRIPPFPFFSARAACIYYRDDVEMLIFKVNSTPPKCGAEF